MLFREKNNDDIELVLNPGERELIFKALRHFSAYNKDEEYVLNQMGSICEILNVLHTPEFDKCDC